MKKINLFLTILAAAAGFTNCSKAELVENKETEKGGSVVYATTDAATKTTLANDYKVLWSEGDQIKFIKSDAPATTYTFTLSSGSGTSNGTFTCDQTPVEGTYTVYYPATYDGTNWPAQTYVSATDISGAPMKATATVGSDGSISDIAFANEGGILRYTVKGSKTIKSINVKSASPALDVTLDCGTSSVALTADGTVFNIALPAGEYSNATLSFTATDNTVAILKASTFKVTKNMVSLATFNGLTFALPGVFSVSETKKVRFSKGNLCAKQLSDKDEMYFEENQYSSKSEWDTGHLSLLTWSSTAREAANNGYSGENLFCDVNHKVSVDGSEAIYYALSLDEWTHLFNTRSNASSLYKCGVTVCGKANCVVLLPDGWQWGGNVGTDWQKNTSDVVEYNEEMTINWSTMEAAGAVCLPAAGYRREMNFSEEGDYGYYWSSNKNEYVECEAYLGVKFDSSNVDLGAPPATRDFGYSIRLVTEVK